MTLLVGLGLAFVIAYIWGFKDKSDQEAPATQVKSEPAQKASAAEELLSPVAGELIDLSSVADPVFSSGSMGQGVAIKPEGRILCSPVDGRVEAALETGHAYVIKSDKGAEILLHIGIDTVSMAGEGFETFVKVGQMVKAGDALGSFDIARIQQAGLDTTTMLLVTNSADVHAVQILAQGKVTVGSPVILVK